MKGKLTLFILFLCVFSFEVVAGLLIAPLRVNFDDRERSKEVYVVNNSAERSTYRIGLKDLAAKPTGGYDKIDGLHPTSAQNMLRFSPKQFTLEPGASQKVKIMARRSSSLAQGEYRSHLSFTRVPTAVSNTESNANGASLKVNVLLNYSLPITVRKGRASTNFKMSKLDIVKVGETYQARVDIEKNHKYSGYGVVKVFWKSSQSAKETQVGILNEFKFFHELNKATATVTLPDFVSERGLYRVVFEGRQEFSGRVLAEMQVRK